jgi:hypothetical protein
MILGEPGGCGPDPGSPFGSVRSGLYASEPIISFDLTATPQAVGNREVGALPDDPNGNHTAAGQDAQDTPAATQNGSARSARREKPESERTPTRQRLPSALPSGLPHVEPVMSGRKWERVDPQPAILQRTNNLLLIRDKADHSVVAYFKWPRGGSKHSSAYSIGIDRVGYELAALLSLPVPATYLEEVEGQHGLVSMRAPRSQPWRALDEGLLRKVTFMNRECWPIVLGLDVLLGNTDRNADSILVQLEEGQRQVRSGQQCVTRFIDYGHSALWPPWKFELNRTAVDLLRADEDTRSRTMRSVTSAAKSPGSSGRRFPSAALLRGRPSLKRFARSLMMQSRTPWGTSRVTTSTQRWLISLSGGSLIGSGGSIRSWTKCSRSSSGEEDRLCLATQS